MRETNMKPRLGIGAWLTLSGTLVSLAYVGNFAVFVVDATSGAYWISQALERWFPQQYDGIVETAEFLYAPLMPAADRLGLDY